MLFRSITANTTFNGQNASGSLYSLQVGNGGLSIQGNFTLNGATVYNSPTFTLSANTANQTYPDQSLYPVDSVPKVVKGINNAFRRADQIQTSEQLTDLETGPTYDGIDYFLPIVADAEAGFGGALNAYELMTHMIEAGAAGVHFEDQ